MAETSQIQRGHPIWLLSGFWLCVAISLAVVARRIATLLGPSSNRPAAMAELDKTFSSHAVLTTLHILPAALFVVCAVVILLRRPDWPWLETLFFTLGAITGLTAYLMSAYAVGGWVEQSAVLVFDSYFLFSLARSCLFRLRGEPARQREWTTRAVAVLLGIATTRPVMGVFFATSRRTHLGPHQFFGIAFWIGFSVNTLIVELWLRSRQRAQRTRMRAPKQ